MMLYWPWRNEEEELLNVDCEINFNANSSEILEKKKEFSLIEDSTLDDYMEQLYEEQSNQNEDENEEAQPTTDGNGGPDTYYDKKNDFGRYTVDIDDSSEGDYHRSSNLFNDLREDNSRNKDNQYGIQSSLSESTKSTAKLNNLLIIFLSIKTS